MRRRTRAGGVAMLAVALAFVGCGDDDSADRSNDATSTSATASSSTTEPTTTTTTQPDATDLPAVQAIIVELIAERDRIVNELVQDPSVVEDDDSQLFEEYRALFTPDSTQPETYLAVLEGMVADGVATRPGPSGVGQETTVDDVLATVDPEAVTFDLCFYNNGELYDVDTEEARTSSAEIGLGGGWARRVDGVWRLVVVEADQSSLMELPLGAPNTCETTTGDGQ